MFYAHIIKLTASFPNHQFVSWFTYIANNLGDKILPWRTPLKIMKYCEFDLPIACIPVASDTKIAEHALLIEEH